MAVEQYSVVAHDWINLESIINDLTQRVVGQELHPSSDPTFADLSLTGDLDITGDLDLGGTLTLDALTASRIVATDASKGLESVGDLTSWIAGSVPVSVADDGDGTITLDINADGINDTHIDWGLGANQVNAADVPIALGVGSPTVDQIQELFDNTGSSGFFTGGILSDGGSGTLDVSAGEGFIRTTNDDNAPLISFKFTGATGLAIPDDTTQYVFVDDAGTINISTDEFIEAPDNIMLGVVTDEGGVISHAFNLGVRLQESIGQMGRYIRHVDDIVRNKRKGGLIFGQSGDANRDVTVTEGQLEWGRTSYPISAFDTSGADTFDTYSAGGFEATGVSAWPNTQYDNAGTLTTMNNNRWAVLWWYIEPDGHIVMLYGRAQYVTEGQAEEEEQPSDSIPNRLSSASVIASKFIFKKSANIVTKIETAFGTPFTGSGVTAHNNLATLAWTSAGHTGTVSTLAGFDGVGVGAEYTESNYLLADGTRAMTGNLSLGFGDLVSEQNPDAVNAIRLKGTASDVDVVLGNGTGYFSVWNVADDNAVFYVNNVGDTDTAGNLTVGGTVNITTVAAEGSDVDKFLVDSSGVVKYRTGAQVLSDVGALAADGTVALAGAWDMGSQVLTNVNIDTGDINPVVTQTHDGNTLQLDGINSDGGAFDFTTSGLVAFNQELTVSKSQNNTTSITSSNTNAGNAALARLRVVSDSGDMTLSSYSNAFAAVDFAGKAGLAGSNSNAVIIANTNNNAGAIDFLTRTGGVHTIQMSIANGGDVSFSQGLIIANGKTIGQAAGPLLTFDDSSNFLEITGCKVGVATTVPVTELDVNGVVNVRAGARTNPTGGASLAFDYQTTAGIGGRLRVRDWDGATWKNFTFQSQDVMFYPNNVCKVGSSSNHVLVAANGDLSFVGTAGFYPRRITQATIPGAGTGATQIDTGELMMWRDSDDGVVYLVYNDTTSGIKSIALG